VPGPHSKLDPGIEAKWVFNLVTSVIGSPVQNLQTSVNEPLQNESYETLTVLAR
jgi:hypothetical protein